MYSLNKTQMRDRVRVPFGPPRGKFPFPISADDYGFYIANCCMADDLWRYCAIEEFIVLPVLTLLPSRLRKFGISHDDPKRQLEEILRVVGEYRYKSAFVHKFHLALTHCLSFAEIASEALEASNDNIARDLKENGVCGSTPSPGWSSDFTEIRLDPSESSPKRMGGSRRLRARAG